MAWAVRLALTVAGGLIAFVISDTFLTGLITGTDTGSVLLQDILPIVLAAGVAIGVLKISFGG